MRKGGREEALLLRQGLLRLLRLILQEYRAGIEGVELRALTGISFSPIQSLNDLIQSILRAIFGE